MVPIIRQPPNGKLKVISATGTSLELRPPRLICAKSTTTMSSPIKLITFLTRFPLNRKCLFTAFLVEQVGLVAALCAIKLWEMIACWNALFSRGMISRSPREWVVSQQSETLHSFPTTKAQSRQEVKTSTLLSYSTKTVTH